MGTTAEKLQAILDSKADIKDAIEAKGVTVGDATLAEYAGKIGEIPAPMEEAPENDVNFYDYDGFRVASYTIAEAKALTALPTPPTHEGLTFQEWNWTLNDIKTYNRQYADIGANYLPTDGATHFRVRVSDLDLITKISLEGNSGTLSINWGDGSISEYTYINQTTQSFTHSYNEGGIYDIKISFIQSDSSGSWSTRQKHSASYWSGNLLYDEIWCGKYFSLSVQNAIAYCGFIKLAISKDTPCIFWGYGSTRIFQLNFPKNVLLDYSTKTIPSNINRISFPKSVYSLSNSSCFGGFISSRLILPEWTDNSVLADNSMRNASYITVLSLPLCTQFATGDNTFSQANLRIIDIVQGWVPYTSLKFSASIFLEAGSMVDFFNKLGTTTNAITLTFGSTNLNKLTAEEKAIATNKGYTLA